MQSEEEAKLITLDTLEAEKREFVVFLNHKLGEGAFGVVKKAIEKGNPYEELAVKIIPYGSKAKRAKIEREIEILKKLPLHPNLVRIIPLKCFSEHNFYIFMEFCEGGTLQEHIKDRNFSEEEALKIFLQILRGYRVLFQAKILHQDLKPDNILIKGGQLKISDFGFSLFYERQQYIRVREGTLAYMPLEKIIEKVYYPSTKSDVYSIGVIMFKLLTHKHPYVNQRVPHSEFLRLLKSNSLQIQPAFASQFSLQFQRIFDLILKMVEKQPQKRVSFEEIYAFIDSQDCFRDIAVQNKAESQSFEVSSPYSITEQSSVVSIPFEISNQNEGSYLSEVERQSSTKKDLEFQLARSKMERYIINNRLVLYFFDRFARRIYVEKIRQNTGFASQHLYNHAVLAILLLQRKIVEEIIAETRQPRLFTFEEWSKFKSVDKHLLSIIRKDQQYMNDLIIENISETAQINVHQQKLLLDESKLNMELYLKKVTQILLKLTAKKASRFKAYNNNELVTICYAFDSLELLNKYQFWGTEDLHLEPYFRSIETEKNAILEERILGYGLKYNIEMMAITEEEEIHSTILI